MKSILNWSPEQPYHFSVGALLTNVGGEICTHHYLLENVNERYREGMGNAEEFYILMRETPETGESIEQAVMRGLKEEFGATGILRQYLGSVQSRFILDGVSVEKTTAYFHVTCESFDTQRRSKDGESTSVIEWVEPVKLAEIMDRLGGQMIRTDRNESKIVRTYLQLVKKSA
jgi:hypothetical protein